jgi:hypothetical protein
MKTKRAAWFAGLGLCLGLNGAAVAADPAATLSLPEPSGYNATTPAAATTTMMVPDSSPATDPPVATSPERDANVPSYTPANPVKKTADPLTVGGAWRLLTGTDRPGGASYKKADPVVSETKPPTQVAVLDGHHGAAVMTPVPPAMPIHAMDGQAPAWRWYGYGAPVPGSNPYAPEGVYGQVNPSWYFQSGATPGAIPMPPAPIAPAMPLLPADLPQPSPAPTLPNPNPTTAEPPRIMTLPPQEQPMRPTIKQAQAIDAPASTEQPATMDLPVPHVSDQQPLSTAPVMRGQAPEPVVSEKLLVSLRLACIGYATKVEMTPKDETRIALRLSLARGMSADRLAERIVQLPELSGYDIEMQFDR